LRQLTAWYDFRQEKNSSLISLILIYTIGGSV
jgi:hypothetical protein